MTCPRLTVPRATPPFGPLHLPPDRVRSCDVHSRARRRPRTCGARTSASSRIADGNGPRPIIVLGRRIAQWVAASIEAAAARLNMFDVVIIQHEYGLYGGRDGDEVLEILDRLTVPCMTVAQTVLRAPSRNQRAVLEAVVDASTASSS